MQLGVDTRGLDRLRQRIANLPQQVRFAAAQALNSTAFQVRADLQTEMRRAFDRPTPWLIDSAWVGKRATPSDLEAWVYLRNRGGKSIDPANVVRAQVYGGQRRNTRAERALQAAGILPRGMAMVPATWVREGQHGDGHGGVKGSFYVQLLSYLQAFGEQGYRANMSQRRRLQLSGRGRWVDGRFHGAHTKRGQGRKGAYAYRQGGVDYFVSRGRGEFTGRGSWKHGQKQHLAAGIWQRSGIYGAVVKPVFLFVRMPAYSRRLQYWEQGANAMRQVFPGQFSAALARAVATAR